MKTGLDHISSIFNHAIDSLPAEWIKLKTTIRDLLEKSYRHENISLIADESIQVYCYEGLLKIALGNIIENAVKYRIDYSKRIEIIIEHDINSILIKVINQGYEIQDNKEIMKMGVRGNNVKDIIEGKGQGLMIVNIIIRNIHKGEIKIDSYPLGNGVSFNTVSIKLPLEK